MHDGKLAYGALAANLIQARLLAGTEDRWLEALQWVMAHLLSHLAADLRPCAPIAVAHH